MNYEDFNRSTWKEKIQMLVENPDDSMLYDEAVILAADWETCAAGQCVFDLTDAQHNELEVGEHIECISDAAGKINHKQKLPNPGTDINSNFTRNYPYETRNDPKTITGLGIYFQDYIKTKSYVQAEIVRKLIQTKLKQKREHILDCLE